MFRESAFKIVSEKIMFNSPSETEVKKVPFVIISVIKKSHFSLRSK